MSIRTSTPGLSSVVRPTLAGIVYQQLLEGILSGRLVSGAPLNVSDIAKELGVSPSPVRDALMRLATQGLVTNNTNHRATVIKFSKAEIEQLFEVREILECAAAERAASQGATAEQLAELRQAVEQINTPADQQKMGRLELDDRYHQLIAVLGGNLALQKEILHVNRRIRVMQWLALNPQRMNVAHDEHLAIVRSIGDHDREAARAAMSGHVRNSLQRVLIGMKSRLD